VKVWDRVLLRGLRSHLPEGATVVALERGRADALGEMRKTTAVLTEDSLFLATSARIETLLTVVHRRDIRSVKLVDEHVAEIRYDDYARARAHVVRLDLHESGDRNDIIAKITP
jgi:hypothetical protein